MQGELGLGSFSRRWSQLQKSDIVLQSINAACRLIIIFFWYDGPFDFTHRQRLLPTFSECKFKLVQRNCEG